MTEHQTTQGPCPECGVRPGYHRGDCSIGRAIYDNLKATLGGVVPCYGDPGGCHMDDRHDCESGCLLLKVYRAGEAASAAKAGPQGAEVW